MNPEDTIPQGAVNVDDAFRRILARQEITPVEMKALDATLAERQLQTILYAYDRALADPQTRMPSYLMCAIEAARK